MEPTQIHGPRTRSIDRKFQDLYRILPLRCRNPRPENSRSPSPWSPRGDCRVRLQHLYSGSFPHLRSLCEHAELTSSSQNGGTLCYPRPDQVSITGIEKLTTYSFSRAFQAHHFCSVCGVYIFIKRFDIDKETWERESTPGFNYETWPLPRPVNLRCFERVEWDEIKIVNYSLKDKGPKYEA